MRHFLADKPPPLDLWLAMIWLGTEVAVRAWSKCRSAVVRSSVTAQPPYVRRVIAYLCKDQCRQLQQLNDKIS